MAKKEGGRQGGSEDRSVADPKAPTPGAPERVEGQDGARKKQKAVESSERREKGCCEFVRTHTAASEAVSSTRKLKSSALDSHNTTCC